MANPNNQNQPITTNYNVDYFISDFSVFNGYYVPDTFADVEDDKVSKTYLFFKRAFDIAVSFVGFVCASPVLLLLSAIVKFSSKGPILFKDRRLGLNGKEIKVYKFRTMYIDAETNIDKYLTEEEKHIWQVERKLDNDPRVTKIGRLLRKTSLDELPQLLNILIGNMSFVGPRPITRREIDANFNYYQQERLFKCKPGLTGYWQVYGRSDVDFKSGERQRLELEYYFRRSFLFDIKLFLLTVPAVLKQKGAK